MRWFNNIKTIPEDLFIKRIRSSVIGEGMLHEGNIYLMDFAIQNMPDGNVVEIGSYGGLSANLMLYLLKKHNRKNLFFSCDPWIYEGYKDAEGDISATIDGRDDVLRTDYMRYIKNAFINSALLLNKDKLPYTFEMTSDKFFSAYASQSSEVDVFGRTIQLNGEIAFAYIDGHHDYEFVKKDFENVNRFLRLNGFILFDDSMDGAHFGSAKLMKEIPFSIWHKKKRLLSKPLLSWFKDLSYLIILNFLVITFPSTFITI